MVWDDVVVDVVVVVVVVVVDMAAGVWFGGATGGVC